MLRSKIAHTTDENVSALQKKKLDVAKKNVIVKDKPRSALGEVGNLVSLHNKLPEKKKTNGNTLNKLAKLPAPISKSSLELLEKKKQQQQAVSSKINSTILNRAALVKKVEASSKINLIESKKDVGKLLVKKNVKESTQKVTSFSSKIFSHSIPSFDANDIKDPFNVSEYAQDIYMYLMKREDQTKIKEDFMKTHSSTTKMRMILVDWIADVQTSFNLLPETFYLAISIIDQYLQLNSTIGRDNLQLVGATAMFIAAKYEEVVLPSLQDVIYICDNFYTKVDILKMEMDIAKKLDFKFSVPLPIQFYRRCCKISKCTEPSYVLGKYILELSLLDHKMSSVKASLKAAAAYCLSNSIMSDTLDPSTVWTADLSEYTYYKYTDLKNVITELALLIKRAADAKQQTIRQKYSKSKSSQIAMHPKLDGPLMKKLTSESNKVK